MNRFILFITPLFILPAVMGQNPVARIQPDTGFINSIIKEKSSPVFLVKEIPGQVLDKIKYYVDQGLFTKGLTDKNGNDISDSLKLTREETAQINNQLLQYTNFQWDQQSAGGLKLNNLSLISMHSGLNGDKENAMKYVIVPPVFFRNSEFSLFYFGYNCGPLCGHGQLVVYRLVNKQWITWQRLYWWDI